MPRWGSVLLRPQRRGLGGWDGNVTGKNMDFTISVLDSTSKSYGFYQQNGGLIGLLLAKYSKAMDLTTKHDIFTGKKNNMGRNQQLIWKLHYPTTCVSTNPKPLSQNLSCWIGRVLKLVGGLTLWLEVVYGKIRLGDTHTYIYTLY